MKIGGLIVTSGTITANSAVASQLTLQNVNVSGNALSSVTGITSTTSGYLNIATPIATSAYISTNYAVTANQAINFDTVLFDTASGNIQSSGMIAVGAANTWKFVAPVAGVYNTSVCLGDNGAVFVLLLYKNGSSYCKLMSLIGTSFGNASAAIEIQLNAGDFISFNSDSSVTVAGSSAPYTSLISISRLR